MYLIVLLDKRAGHERGVLELLGHFEHVVRYRCLHLALRGKPRLKLAIIPGKVACFARTPCPDSCGKLDELWSARYVLRIRLEQYEVHPSKGYRMSC